MEIVEMVTPQPKLVFLGDLQNLDKQVDSLMTPSNTIISDGRNKNTRAQICNICGKEGKRSHMRGHIEAKHIKGISIPKPFIYEARESSLVPEGFLTAQFLQKL